MPKQTIDDQTVNPPKFKTAIHKVKDKERERRQLFIDEAFIETKTYKANMLTYRAQEQGVDPTFNDTFKGKDAPLSETLPGVNSMLLYKLVNIISSRWYTAFNSEHGDYLRAVPQKASAVNPAKALTHLGNYYLRQNRFYKKTLYQAFRGAAINGVWILRNYWNYKTIATDVARPLGTIVNPRTGQLEISREVIDRRTQIQYDRPEIKGVDPLFFALPKGSSDIGGEEGAQTCIEKRIFFRHELEALEAQGFISGFNKLKQNEAGINHNNVYESSEMKQFYDELFDDELNKGRDWEDPHYRVWVDVMMEAPTFNAPINEYWMINGNIVRAETYEGGHELPYTLLNYVPTATNWMGMGIPEISQDYYKEFNLVIKIALNEARRAGKSVIMYPRDANISQSEFERMFSQGGPVSYDDNGDGIPPQAKFPQFQLGDASASLLQHREFLSQQVLEENGISVTEVAGGQIQHNIRSGSMVQGLNSTGSGPALMQISLMGESMGRVYDKFAQMIYRLQSEPVQVIIDPNNAEIQTIGIEDLDRLPDVIMTPNASTGQLGAELMQMVPQVLPFLQGLIDVPSFVKLMFELGVTPEVGRRINEVMALPPTPVLGNEGQPAGPNGQPGAPVTGPAIQ